MRNFRITLRYDGTNFCGWQRQLGRRSVQESVEAAIAAITQETTVRLNASGRTDAGVHALAQVANFFSTTRLDCPTLLRGINAQLPPDIIATDLAEVPQSFDANKDALSKRYRYVVQTGPWPDPLQRHYAWYVRGPLDVSAMRQAALYLIGRHDFQAFTTSGSERLNTIRTVLAVDIDGASYPTTEKKPLPILARSPSDGQYLLIEVEADGFLYNMVRAIVGSLIEVGRGRWSPEQVRTALLSKDRRHAGPTAPPHGLFLLAVRYACSAATGDEPAVAQHNPTARPWTTESQSPPCELSPGA
ncbi:MAG: tRNA pseudouridine(38-40) synthase TruA [Gemmataceae bacterium]|nr:tRNA pseudouridine(38-40) synthase TruA [Gemmataceae bacterium]